MKKKAKAVIGIVVISMIGIFVLLIAGLYYSQVGNVQISDFEDEDDWVGSNSDTKHVKKGLTSRGLESDGYCCRSMRIQSNFDFSDADYFSIWVYTDNTEWNNGGIQLYATEEIDVSVDDSEANVYQCLLGKPDTKGWNLLQVKKSDCTVRRGTPDWSKIQTIYIYQYPTSPYEATVYYDDFRELGTIAYYFNTPALSKKALQG